jgi:hypothetical protein
MSAPSRSHCAYLKRTTETMARFVQPLMLLRDETREEPPDWVAKLTKGMEREFSRSHHKSVKSSDSFVYSANSGRIYLEQLHLHPVRIGLTFTQEWIESDTETDTAMIFQFIRGMVRLLHLFLKVTNIAFSYRDL